MTEGISRTNEIARTVEAGFAISPAEGMRAIGSFCAENVEHVHQPPMENDGIRPAMDVVAQGVQDDVLLRPHIPDMQMKMLATPRTDEVFLEGALIGTITESGAAVRADTTITLGLENNLVTRILFGVDPEQMAPLFVLMGVGADPKVG